MGGRRAWDVNVVIQGNFRKMNIRRDYKFRKMNIRRDYLICTKVLDTRVVQIYTEIDRHTK